ncbi:MAG: transglutaminase-like cysteine peptidase [Halioglobus sp.]
MSLTRIHRPSIFSHVTLYATLLAAAVAVAQVDFDHMRKLAASRYGQQTAQQVDHWQREIAHMRNLPEPAKLERANHFFNSRIRWVTDISIWQQQDYWATPLELLGRGMGDCEDFAIAKYTMLVLAGVNVDRLRITYVKAKLGGPRGERSQPHMVLAYYPTAAADPLVLDNIVPQIQKASLRNDLTPVYGFNSNGIWIGGAAQPASRKPAARLSRWRDVLRRAAAEGLG